MGVPKSSKTDDLEGQAVNILRDVNRLKNGLFVLFSHFWQKYAKVVKTLPKILFCFFTEKRGKSFCSLECSPETQWMVSWVFSVSFPESEVLGVWALGMLKGRSSATKRLWPPRGMMSIDVIFPYGLMGWTWVQSYERTLLGSIHLIESIVFATQMGWIHGHCTHYQQGTLGKFKISFWRTSQCVSYSVGIVTWRIAGGANSPYYRHCAGIVNTDRKTHQFADGSWANGSKKSCKFTTFSVNVAVAELLSPKLQFLEYLNYDILWDPTPAQDSKKSTRIFWWNIFFTSRLQNGPVGSMGLVYLPAWMVVLYGKCL